MRLLLAYMHTHSIQICDRAQDDEQYHSAVDTLFNLMHKWINRSLDTAGDVNKDTSLEAFINDPTPDQHLIKGIRGLRAVLQRLAGGMSLDNFFNALRVCSVDIHQDDSIRLLCDRSLQHARRCVDESGYVRSEEADEASEQLRKQWEKLSDKDSKKGKKWKEDVGKVKAEAEEFERAIATDADLRKVRAAHSKLGKDLEESLIVAGGTGLQAMMEKAPWFWQDLFNFYLPNAVGMLKNIPIPRYAVIDTACDNEFSSRMLGRSTRTPKLSLSWRILTSRASACSPDTHIFETSLTSTLRLPPPGRQTPLSARSPASTFKRCTSPSAKSASTTKIRQQWSGPPSLQACWSSPFRRRA